MSLLSRFSTLLAFATLLAARAFIPLNTAFCVEPISERSEFIFFKISPEFEPSSLTFKRTFVLKFIFFVPSPVKKPSSASKTFLPLNLASFTLSLIAFLSAFISPFMPFCSFAERAGFESLLDSSPILSALSLKFKSVESAI